MRCGWLSFMPLFIGFLFPTAGQDEGTLLLVRQFEKRDMDGQKTEELRLIGWLPMHNAAMEFVFVSGKLPSFAPDEAVSIMWLRDSDGKPRLKRQDTLVRIKNGYFRPTSLFFGPCIWEKSARVSRRPTS